MNAQRFTARESYPDLAELADIGNTTVIAALAEIDESRKIVEPEDIEYCTVHDGIADVDQDACDFAGDGHVCELQQMFYRGVA